MPNKKKALKVPNKVKIGYSLFNIESRDEAWKERNGAVGMCKVDKSLIEYCKEQSQPEIVNTIIHEILHAVVYMFDIDFDTAKKEECLVTKMANGLHTLILDNPELLKWLVESCKNEKK
ncbi:MAG: hypothetical protein ACK5GV_08565 [Bacteroidota bacterium]|jgi:hypothetical protein